MIITVDEMKKYLRVDTSDEDELIENLIAAGQELCMNVARIEDMDEFEATDTAKFSVMYAVAYLYEHREEAGHKSLALDLRSLLFGQREAKF